MTLKKSYTSLSKARRPGIQYACNGLLVDTNHHRINSAPKPLAKWANDNPDSTWSQNATLNTTGSVHVMTNKWAQRGFLEGWWLLCWIYLTRIAAKNVPAKSLFRRVCFLCPIIAPNARYNETLTLALPAPCTGRVNSLFTLGVQ